MQTINGFDFYALRFDADGNLAAGNEFDSFRQAIAGGQATDAIILAHGFRNDENDAANLYTNFLGTLHAHLPRAEFSGLGQRKFVAAGVFWPSMAFPENVAADGSVQSADENGLFQVTAEEKLAALKAAVPSASTRLEEAATLLPQIENDASVQDRFAELVMGLLDGSELDATEGWPLIRQQPGSELLPKLIPPVILPTVKKPDSDGSALSFENIDTRTVASFGSLFQGIAGGVDKFLNMTTWYVMKDRSGVVGANGVAKTVRDIKAANPVLRVHLVGHSLGGRLMASCSKSLTQSPAVKPASLTLLEAAFSHYGFSENNGKGSAGFFRDVIEKQTVDGPMVETFSYQDTVVGIVYAVASRIAGDNVKAVGDAQDQFGGIGRNGCQLTTESAFQPLKAASESSAPYTFQTGVINCLDGSGGLIKNHGDVTNPDVTYAFASVLLSAGAPKPASASAAS